MEEWISVFRREFGDRFRTDEEVLSEYLSDATPLYLALLLKGEELPKPAAVLRVESEEDVVKALEIALKHRVPVVPRGGGSGVVGGALPVEGSIILDLRGLRWINVYPEDMLVDVGAGIYGYELEERLNAMGYTLRHTPQSFYDSTIGGWISTAAVGQYSTMYGGIEDMVISIRVAIPRLGLLEVGGLPRRSSGPDLRRLFIGSEGALGVVTGAKLRILPLPEDEARLSYTLSSFEEGLRFIKKLILKGVGPAIIRLYDHEDVALWFEGLPEVQDKNLLIMVVEGEGRLVRAKVELIEGELPETFIAMGEEPVNYWLRNRFKRVSDVVKYIRMGILFDTLDVAALWGRLPALYKELKARLKELDGVMHVSAHASHFYISGGCIYYTVAGISEKVAEFYSNLWRTAESVVRRYGGTISHHHGIGMLKVPYIAGELEGAAELLRLIKESLDPEGILNPGKLVPSRENQ